MRELFDSLFSLRKLSAADESVTLEFARSMPLWGWIGVVLALGLFACWSYSRLLGPRWARYALGTVRTLALVLVALIIAGPRLVKQSERIEKDWVVVMVDRSASLGVPDAPGGEAAARRAREQQLRSLIGGAWPTFGGLMNERNVLFVGFDGGAFDLKLIPGSGPGSPPMGLDLGEPEGRRTRIGQSLEQVVRRTAAKPLAGVVLFTDGRSADAPGRSVLRQLTARQVPIFPVPLGDPSPLLDPAVLRVDATSSAFVGDLIPVTADLAMLGAEGDARPRGVVRLVDDATGLVLDERRLGDNDERAAGATRITLVGKPEAAGRASWSVVLVPEGADISEENNRVAFAVELADRPINVLYVDGYPRWEYRYLKNHLVREQSIRSSVTMLSSDKRYIQEGTEVLASLPRTAQEWARFDAIILGDLRPDVFSAEQLRQIKAVVAQRGTGLMWVAGGGAVPGAWRGTPLEDLIPFSIAQDGGSTGGAVTPVWLEPVVMSPAPAAGRYGVLRLGESADDGWIPELSSGTLPWSLFRWVQRIPVRSMKPAAESLAWAVPASGAVRGDDSQRTPMVMTMRYGAGRTVYVATDEIWRYRFGRGETLPERFWIPLVRLLARESLGRSGKPAVLQVAPQRALTDQPVRITVKLLDQSLLDANPETIRVRIQRTQTARDADVFEQIELRPERSADEAEGGVGTYSAAWLTAEPGSYAVRAIDPLLAGLELAAQVDVQLPEDELRAPQADHALLNELAAQTGGTVLDAAGLARLPNLLPNRELRLLGTPEIETLWDKPVVLTMLVVLLTLEWAGRRLIKLS